MVILYTHIGEWGSYYPSGAFPRWRIGECVTDMGGTEEIKYSRRTKTSSWSSKMDTSRAKIRSLSSRLWYSDEENKKKLPHHNNYRVSLHGSYKKNRTLSPRQRVRIIPRRFKISPWNARNIFVLNNEHQRHKKSNWSLSLNDFVMRLSLLWPIPAMT